MRGHDIVVVGGSAGGVDALSELVSTLDPALPAAVFVVLHTHSRSPRQFDRVISDRGALPARYARLDEPIEPGRIYLAVPNRHLLVKEDRVLLSAGPRENRCRPAIDPLFRSAAVAHGARVLGVILTGLQDDGSAGLQAVKRCGGKALVQDPRQAAHRQMPEAAMAAAQVEFVGTPGQLGEEINRLARTPADRPGRVPPDLVAEVVMTERAVSETVRSEALGDAASLSCPSCGGPLWRKDDGGRPRYRCLVGHAYSEKSLLADQDEALERALWAALRILEERVRLLRRMAEDARAASRTGSGSSLLERADEAAAEAQTIRSVLGAAIGESDPAGERGKQ